MYANSDIPGPVPVKVNAGSYSVSDGVKRLPEIASVPCLDVAATLNQSGKTPALFWVSLSLVTDIVANIRVHKFAVGQTVKVGTLSSHSPDDANGEVFPTRVQPAESVKQFHAGGLTHTFPLASVTVICLNRK